MHEQAAEGADGPPSTGATGFIYSVDQLLFYFYIPFTVYGLAVRYE